MTCAHCRRLQTDGTGRRDLSTAQAKDLIKQLADLGRSQTMMPVLVFSGGEPLCRDDLFELIAQACKAGITPALATNGTLIDEDLAGQIQKSGISRVAVSLDGATADVHDRLRQLEGAFEKAIEGIRLLHKKNLPFQINFTMTKNNAFQLEDIYVLAKSLGAVALHIFMLVPVGCGQVLAETDMLSPQQYEQKLLQIYQLENRGQLQIKVTCGPHYQRIIRQQQIQNSRLKTQDSNRGCLAGTGILFVSHRGDVFPCGYLPLKCGNILDEQLSTIWRNSQDLLRMCNSDNLLGKCGKCGYKYVCGGCRARAYAATGDYLAEEPFCIYIPHSVTDLSKKPDEPEL